MRWVKAKERTLHYQEQCISNSLVFHQLPNIGPKQLFALALLECTYKVGTSQSSSKPTSSHFIRRKRIYLAKVSKTLPCKFNKFPNMHFNNMKLVSYMVVVKRYIRNILGLYCGYQGEGERESSAIGGAFATKGLITSISYTKELQPYFGESWNS